MLKDLIVGLQSGTKVFMDEGWVVARNTQGDYGIVYGSNLLVGIHGWFVEDAMISFHVIPQRGMEIRMMGQPVIKLPNPTLIGN